MKKSLFAFLALIISSTASATVLETEAVMGNQLLFIFACFVCFALGMMKGGQR